MDSTATELTGGGCPELDLHASSHQMGGHSGLSLVMLLITLKSGSEDASIGQMFELLACKLGFVAVEECPANPLNLCSTSQSRPPLEIVEVCE